MPVLSSVMPLVPHSQVWLDTTGQILLYLTPRLQGWSVVQRVHGAGAGRGAAGRQIRGVQVRRISGC
jgi:hypothetical protein